MVTKIKTIATNRKAYHNYFIQDSIEAGIISAYFVPTVIAVATNKCYPKN